MPTATQLWYQEYLQTDHWREMRRKCYDRYGNRCSIVGCMRNNLAPHHLSYQYVGEMRELQDLRPLCKWHHWLGHHHLFTPWKRIPLNRENLTKRYMQIKRFTWQHFRFSDWFRL